ncbi:hypothetical protein VCB98_07860 [Gammaproteobacteria bacterium AB-CW1]|uniref:Tetratricopeptide repeat protein n=1 Tax=Natronospira elongata TaxID=3110268 RepID=A0AAP6JFL1_9GAMM|nr:hypothetical protein [Gammaproteobacteria bacterium AB-CW1]
MRKAMPAGGYRESLARARALGLILTAIILSGCATYGQEVGEALTLADAGYYEAAQEGLEQVLDADGNDRLLYHLERGAVAHLAGDFEQSIVLLAEAEMIGEDLYTRYFRDGLRSAMSNPRNAPYRGTVYELAYIHYYQALNFAALAQASDNWRDRRDHLDSALVETRKLDARLHELSILEGSYEEVSEGGRRNTIMSSLLVGFHGMSEEIADRDSLRFRDAAWLRYLTGVLYEMAGELDNARIAYTQAAQIYEDGYAAQYLLGEDFLRQAWFDAYRLQHRTDGWRGREDEARQRIGADGVERISNSSGEEAHLLVIQHVDRLPPRGELNLIMYADPRRRSITLQPWTGGTHDERLAQSAWFQTMYADTGPLAMMVHYSQGGLEGAFRGVFEKSFYVGPLWGQLESWGIIRALQGGVRVTVPYPGPPRPEVSPSFLEIDGQREVLARADNLTMMAYQDMLLSAGDELRREVARRLLQNALAELAAQEMEERGGLLGQLGGLAARTGTAAASRADTRAWQTLPAEVRVARIPVEPGTSRVRLRQGEFLGGEKGLAPAVEVSLEPGEIRLLMSRRLSNPPSIELPGDSEGAPRLEVLTLN